METEMKAAPRRPLEMMERTPVFTGTRVPCGVLLEYLQGGDTLDTFLSDFPLVRRQQAIAVLELAKKALDRVAR